MPNENDVELANLVWGFFSRESFTDEFCGDIQLKRDLTEVQRSTPVDTLLWVNLKIIAMRHSNVPLLRTIVSEAERVSTLGFSAKRWLDFLMELVARTNRISQLKVLLEAEKQRLLDEGVDEETSAENIRQFIRKKVLKDRFSGQLGLALSDGSFFHCEHGSEPELISPQSVLKAQIENYIGGPIVSSEVPSWSPKWESHWWDSELDQTLASRGF